MLILELCKLDNEIPWVEFKHNNYDPYMIGKSICALANSATLHEKSCAYMLWGINDQTHEIVGTDHNLQSLKKGNQELENWLRSLLSDNADFEFHSVQVNDKTIGVLIIYKATYRPVMFEGVDYIRIGSYTKKLKDHPSVQAQLWDRIRNESFEEQCAKQDLDAVAAIQLLDYSVYFETTKIPAPTNTDALIHYLTEEGILLKQDNGLFAITNMGAILFAKKLSDFPKLFRKAVRIVQYSGNNRLSMMRENVSDKGYATGFEEVINFVEAVTPAQELIVGALRETKHAYPNLAIRESVGNALIHQDFSVTGTGPVVEIFEKRIEITNSGVPMVDIRRIIDNPPKSRNEKLASLMRRMRMCEELGTGWDKIVISCELQQLPAPKIEVYSDGTNSGSTKVTLYSDIPFSNIPPEGKLWACYLHACIKHVQGEQMTNASLRARFGLKDSSSGSVSRLIKEAVAKGLIKPLDPNTAPRSMKYIPAWVS